MTDFTPLPALAGGVLIGLAATLLMATLGRVAGVSGFVSRLLPPYTDGAFAIRAAFVGGLIAAPLIHAKATGGAIPLPASGSGVLLAAAGLLVGFGAVWGNGCTSGHGVCGLARLSKRSAAATLTFMATAVLTVFITRHVL